MLDYNNSGRTALIALVIACSVWGSAFLFGKFALTVLTVSQVVLYRFALASLALLPIVLARGVWPRRRDLPLFFLTGFLTVPVTFLLQFGGLALTSVASASLIVGALPPLLSLAAALFSHDRLSARNWGMVMVSTLGVLLIIGWPGSRRNWLGDALVLASMLTSVAWILLSKRLIERYSALATSSYTLTFGALTLLPFSLLWDGLPPLHLARDVWASVLALGLGCTALTYALWNWGLERVPASRASVFLNLEPVVGALLGVIVLQESLGLTAVIGGALILAAAWLVSQPERDLSVDQDDAVGVTSPIVNDHAPGSAAAESSAGRRIRARDSLFRWPQRRPG
jgi:drug/metabolite transporter (DMT)-like permease